MSTLLKGTPPSRWILALLIAPFFLVSGYAMLWRTGVRWLAIVFGLLASLSLVWPILAPPAAVLMLVMVVLWGWTEMRSTSRNATRNLSSFARFMRRIGYSLGLFVHPWGGALRRVTIAIGTGTPQAQGGPSAENVERLVTYDRWQQQLRRDARARREDLLEAIRAQREQLVMLGGLQTLGEVGLAIEYTGLLWP